MIWPLLILLSLPSFADSQRAFTTSWSCPTDNRGNMPEQRAVTVSYNDRGEIKLRPDIFANDPLSFVTNLFRKKRSSSALAECTNGFMAGLESPLALMRIQCASNPTAFCSKSDEEIRNDIAQKIRGSAFYRRYQSDLAAAESSLGTPVRAAVVDPVVDPAVTSGSSVTSDVVPPVEVTTPEVTTPVVTNPVVTTPVTEVPAITTAPPRIPVEAQTLPPARLRSDEDDSSDDATNRARVLDLMMENSSIFSERTADGRTTKFALFRANCPDLGATSGASGAWCRQTWNEYSRFMNRLTPLLSSLKGRTVSQEDVLSNLDCVPPDENFSDIEGLLRGLDRSRDCSPIAPGSFRRFPVGNTKHHNYLLKRAQDGNYEATIVMNFNYQSGTVNAAQMQARANACYQQFAPYLKAPNGEQLRVRMLNPTEANSLSVFERPPTLNAVILQGVNGGTEVRGNTATYTDGFRCETILHETLHYLGLCDEYRERDNSPRTKADGTPDLSLAEGWSCRVVPERNTIMSDHAAAIRSTVPLKYSCQCQNDSCRRTLAGTDANSRTLQALMQQPQSYTVFPNLGTFCRPLAPLGWNPFPDNNPDKRVVVHSADPSNFIVESKYLGAVPGYGLAASRGYTHCSCDGNEECEAIIRQGIENLRKNTVNVSACPEGTVSTVGEDAGPLRFSPGATLAGENESTNASNGVLTIVTTPEFSSQALLAPNQLSRIIYGNCDSGPAASYNQCAAYATIPRSDTRCDANRQAQCSDRNFLGVENE